MGSVAAIIVIAIPRTSNSLIDYSTEVLNSIPLVYTGL